MRRRYGNQFVPIDKSAYHYDIEEKQHPLVSALYVFLVFAVAAILIMTVFVWDEPRDRESENDSPVPEIPDPRSPSRKKSVAGRARPRVVFEKTTRKRTKAIRVIRHQRRMLPFIGGGRKSDCADTPLVKTTTREAESISRLKFGEKVSTPPVRIMIIGPESLSIPEYGEKAITPCEETMIMESENLSMPEHGEKATLLAQENPESEVIAKSVEATTASPKKHSSSIQSFDRTVETEELAETPAVSQDEEEHEWQREQDQTVGESSAVKTIGEMTSKPEHEEKATLVVEENTEPDMIKEIEEASTANLNDDSNSTSSQDRIAEPEESTETTPVPQHEEEREWGRENNQAIDENSVVDPTEELISTSEHGNEAALLAPENPEPEIIAKSAETLRASPNKDSNSIVLLDRIVHPEEFAEPVSVSQSGEECEMQRGGNDQEAIDDIFAVDPVEKLLSGPELDVGEKPESTTSKPEDEVADKEYDSEEERFAQMEPNMSDDELIRRYEEYLKATQSTRSSNSSNGAARPSIPLSVELEGLTGTDSDISEGEFQEIDHSEQEAEVTDSPGPEGEPERATNVNDWVLSTNAERRTKSPPRRPVDLNIVIPKPNSPSDHQTAPFTAPAASMNSSKETPTGILASLVNSRSPQAFKFPSASEFLQRMQRSESVSVPTSDEANRPRSAGDISATGNSAAGKLRLSPSPLSSSINSWALRMSQKTVESSPPTSALSLGDKAREFWERENRRPSVLESVPETVLHLPVPGLGNPISPLETAGISPRTVVKTQTPKRRRQPVPFWAGWDPQPDTPQESSERRQTISGGSEAKQEEVGRRLSYAGLRTVSSDAAKHFNGIG